MDKGFRVGLVVPVLSLLVAGMTLPTTAFAQDGGTNPEEPSELDGSAAEKAAKAESAGEDSKAQDSAGPNVMESSDDAAARAAYLRGRTLFEEQRYDESAAAFDEAYRLSKRPLLLLSIASAHERSGRFDLALRTLRAYRPYADQSNVGEVEYRIAALEDRVSSVESKTKGDTDSEVALKEPAQPPQRSTNWAGWMTTGLGAASLGTGVAFLVLGDMDHQDVANATTREEAQDLIDSGDQKKLIGYITAGFGGAAIVTGVVLLATGIGTHEVEADNSTAFSFTPMKDGGLVSVQGRF